MWCGMGHVAPTVQTLRAFIMYWGATYLLLVCVCMFLFLLFFVCIGKQGVNSTPRALNAKPQQACGGKAAKFAELYSC